MRNRMMPKLDVRSCFFPVIVLLASLFAYPSIGNAKNAAPAAQSAASSKSASAKSSTPAKAFDPHDLSGVWGGQSIGDMTKDEPPMSAWGLARYKMAKTNWSNPPVTGAEDNDPVLSCEPSGIPRLYNGFAHPMKFVQTPNEIYQLFEADDVFRVIHMNRQHPEHGDSLWYGDSIGHWEGNTLVVDTTDFNDRTWLDRSGHPHSDKLHLIERFTRTDKDHLHLDITIDDPIAYTKTWGGPKNFKLQPADWELQEYLCSPTDEQEVIKKVMAPESAPAK